jgi:hypothetical protein
LAPKIYDTWKCSHGGVIVMESMKITLISLIKKCISDSKPQFIYLLMKNVMECYLKLTQLGICHADTHLENIMVDFTNESELYRGNFVVKFIDFGQSFHPELSEKLLSKPLDRQLPINWKQVQTKCMDGYSIYNNFQKDVEPLVVSEVDRFFFEYTRLLIYKTIHVSYLEQPSLTHPDWTKKYKLKPVPSIPTSYVFSNDDENSYVASLFKTQEEKQEEKEREQEELDELFGDNEEEELKLLRKK